ncbi:hypothetical protein [Haloferula sp.]|uniref:hypothetical protein n=1 Tax=Haloferula sp. TaxID=2497595 RepID=UPI00329B9E25
MRNFFSGLKLGRVFVALLVAGVSSQVMGADRIAKAVFIEPPKGAPEKVFFVALEKDAIEVPLPRRNFSPDVKLPKGDLVYAILPRPLGEEEPIPKGAPTVKIPSDWSRCYLLFNFDKDNKVFPLEVLAIDGSLNKFPPGDSRFVNLSQAWVKGKFGDKPIAISPGKIKNVEAPIKEFGPFYVALDYMEKGDEKSTPLERTNWQHNPRSRQVVLITKAAGSRYPTISALQDRVKVVEE